MRFFFDPLDKACKSVTGGIVEHEKIRFCAESDAEKVEIVFFRDGGAEKPSPMKRRGGFFVCEKSFYKGLYWYYFLVDGKRFGKSADVKAEMWSRDNFQLTVYSKNYRAPRFSDGGIIYQIFPDRFCREGDFGVPEGKIKREDWGGLPTYRSADGKVYNNEFFGGNFKGITAKLDYLKTLGVSHVYLNPIYKAYSSHRYDVGDYTAVDPVLGNIDDLKNMIAEGEKRGITFIFDGVFNHTGADSRYFNRYDTYPTKGAYGDKKSPFHDWYVFKNYPDDYECWWGFENLPSIDKRSLKFQRYITGTVIPFYLSLGFRGVRLDVVDELSDNFVKKITRSVKRGGKDNVVIGEVWEDATNKIAYGERRKYFLGEELDSVMNYPLKDGIVGYLTSGDEQKLVKIIREQVNNFPKPALDNLMNVLSTHDTSRILTVLGRKTVQTNKDLMRYEDLCGEDLERGRRLFKMAYAVIFTVYGVPSVYYGDEAGLWGDLDPYNRKCFPWGSEDADLTRFIKKLSEIRSERSELKRGSTRMLYAENKVLVYEREYEGSKTVVALSMFESDVKITFGSEITDAFSGDVGSKFVLPPNAVMIFKNN